MNENPQQELPLWSESKLASPPTPEATPASRALAGAVRELAGKDLGPDARNALVRKLRNLFPELMALRGEHDVAGERRKRQITKLGPFLKGIRPILSEEGGAGTEEERNQLIDESVRLMWELSETEREIETLQAQETALRDTILSSVRPEHHALVRWALTQA